MRFQEGFCGKSVDAKLLDNFEQIDLGMQLSSSFFKESVGNSFFPTAALGKAYYTRRVVLFPSVLVSFSLLKCVPNFALARVLFCILQFKLTFVSILVNVVESADHTVVETKVLKAINKAI
jgi:hypothetical protein